MAAYKQNVNYDLKEVARTTESLTESVENVTEIIETISNLAQQIGRKFTFRNLTLWHGTGSFFVTYPE